MKLTAYNVKTKEKNVPIQNATVRKLKRGQYIVKGDDGAGNKLSTLVGEEKAIAAVEAGDATLVEPNA